jgi:hypothetical protein
LACIHADNIKTFSS